MTSKEPIISGEVCKRSAPNWGLFFCNNDQLAVH